MWNSDQNLEDVLSFSYEKETNENNKTILFKQEVKKITLVVMTMQSMPHFLKYACQYHTTVPKGRAWIIWSWSYLKSLIPRNPFQMLPTSNSPLMYSFIKICQGHPISSICKRAWLTKGFCLDFLDLENILPLHHYNSEGQTLSDFC